MAAKVNDKHLHFIAGFVIAGAALVFFNLAWAIIAVLIAGAGKEMYDLIDYGQSDYMDFIATALGGAACIGIYSLIKYFLWT